MKLLFVVATFYDGKDSNLKNQNNGLAIIAGDICRNFSNNIMLNVFVTGRPRKGEDLGYGNIVSTSVFALLKEFRITMIKNIRFKKFSKETLRTIFNDLLLSRFKRVFYNNDFDIVAIHDLNDANLEILKFCMALGVKCVVTLHMYVGKDSPLDGKSHMMQAQRERMLFEETNIPITVVSLGMKRRILNDYSHVDPKRITVIPNGTRLPSGSLKYQKTSDILINHDGKKLFLCIGLVGKCKNQLQLLYSLACLDPLTRSQIKMLFIGKDSLNGELQRRIIEKQLGDVAEYIGEVKHEDLAIYYRNAYAVVSTSINEAFGLTFIEGFSYGVPAVFFDNIDAVEELYSPESVILIHGKENHDIARAISIVSNKTWNADRIKEHAKNFDICKMTASYEEIYTISAFDKH